MILTGTSKKQYVLTDLAQQQRFRRRRRLKFPFRKRSLFSKRHFNFFDLLLREVSMKTKEDRNPGSNPDHNLISLPYHYTTTPTRQNFKYVFLK